MGCEAEGIFVREDVQAQAVGDGQAPSADRVQAAVAAGPAACAIAFGQIGVINVVKLMFGDVSDQRGKFPAGVHLAVGQQRQEVECRSAAVAGASAEQRLV